MIHNVYIYIYIHMYVFPLRDSEPVETPRDSPQSSSERGRKWQAFPLFMAPLQKDPWPLWP